MPIDVRGSLSDEAIYEVKDIKTLIDTAKSTKQTRIDADKNKTTYQEDLVKAKKDWEKAKKGYETLLKDQKATSEQVKNARDEIRAKEKAYKDLGGITGSSLTKQENQADKLRKDQQKSAEELLTLRRQNQRDEISLMKEGTQKKHGKEYLSLYCGDGGCLLPDPCPAAHIDPETDQKSVYPVILILRPICDVSCYDVSGDPLRHKQYGVGGASAGHRNHRGVVRKKSPVCCGDLLCDGIRHGNFLSVAKIHKTHIFNKTKAVSVSDHPSIK